METPLHQVNWESTPSNIHYSSFKTTMDRKICFAITYPETEKSNGTIIILENCANTLEKYFLPINEISKRGFYTAIFNWFDKEKTSFKTRKQNRYYYFDINNDINDLYEFFKNIVYPHCPPPYSILAYGIGGLIALSGLDFINRHFNRLLCVSPLFAPFGNKTNSFQHKLTQFFSDIGLGFIPVKDGKKIKQLRHTHKVPTPSISSATSRWMASAFNAIDSVKKNLLHGHLQIPTLFILANQNNIANNIEVRQLCQNIRLTENITIRGAELDTIMYKEDHKKQFWAAFDAFIPNDISVK